MFAKSEYLHLGAVAGDLLEWLTERLPVGGSHEHAGKAFGATQGDVLQHVAVDVAVLVDLGFGEDRESHVAQRFDPRPHDVGATWGDVGEDGGFRLQRDGGFATVGPLLREFRGAGEQPAAEGVEPWTMRGRR